MKRACILPGQANRWASRGRRAPGSDSGRFAFPARRATVSAAGLPDRAVNSELSRLASSRSSCRGFLLPRRESSVVRRSAHSCLVRCPTPRQGTWIYLEYWSGNVRNFRRLGGSGNTWISQGCPHCVMWARRLRLSHFCPRAPQGRPKRRGLVVPILERMSSEPDDGL